MHGDTHPPGSPHSAVDIILATLAGLTLILGVIGYGFLGPVDGEDCGESPQWWFFDWAYRTLVLFEPAEVNLRIWECFPHPVIAIARLTGLAAFIVAGVRILYTFARKPLTQLQIRRAKDHTVVIGFGETGQVRAREARGKGGCVVVLDSESGPLLDGTARRHGVLLATGDARDPDMLAQIRVTRASHFVIATGDDALNLATAETIAQHLRDTSKIAPPPQDGIRIDVAIENPVIRRAIDSAGCDEMIDPFSIADIGARHFCETARLHELADLRGHARIHLVVIGVGALRAGFLAQILRTSVAEALGGPRLSILSADPDHCQAALDLALPEITALAAITFHRLDPTSVRLDAGPLMPRIEEFDPVTAILVLGHDGTDTLLPALAIRDATQRTGRWQAPIFVATKQPKGFSGIGRDLDRSKRLSEWLIPVEVSSELCRRDYSEARDVSARLFHEAYLAFQADKRATGSPGTGADESLNPWPTLRRTYRQANRRAVDHIATKLHGLGCVVPAGPLRIPRSLDILESAGSIERLAMLEHRAWEVDRQLDGWRYGPVRDNARRLHPLIRPYAELDDTVKSYDRDSVRVMERFLRDRPVPPGAKPDTPLVRFDLWLGIVGAGTLTAPKAEQLRDAIRRDIVPALLKAHPDHHITLLTALTPGVELVATQAVLQALGTHNHPHRLLVIEALAPALAIKEFEAAWHEGAVGGLDLPESCRDWSTTAKELGATIDRVCSAQAGNRIIDDDAAGPGRSPEQRENARRRVDANIVQRAHVLLAFVKPSAAPAEDRIDAVIAWRRDRSTLPAGLPRYAPRPNKADEGTPDLIVIDGVTAKTL
ncbi:MAG: NAD-binding protein [Azospirillaceae bacterium]|nr:NAD-binding protein [Azospirillaceae bacterium]